MPVPDHLLSQDNKPASHVAAGISIDRLLAVLGLAVGLFGIIISVYFYQKAKLVRELSYDLSPTRATIVRSGQSSRLATTFDGKSVTTDISAAAITFWNSGNEPIRADHILSPVFVRLKAAAILEATITSQSRPSVTQAHISQTDSSGSGLTVSWRILEPRDAVSIQLIYAGGPDIPVRVEGAIEDQRDILARSYVPPDQERVRAALLFPKSRLASIVIPAAIIVAYLYIVGVTFRRVRRYGIRRRVDFVRLVLLLVGIGNLIVISWILFRAINTIRGM